MVAPDEFFTEEEKMHLAQLVTSFTLFVRDKDSFNEFLLELRNGLTHEDATLLLTMSTAVIASVSRQTMDQAAIMLANIKATEN